MGFGLHEGLANGAFYFFSRLPVAQYHIIAMICLMAFSHWLDYSDDLAPRYPWFNHMNPSPSPLC